MKLFRRYTVCLISNHSVLAHNSAQLYLTFCDSIFFLWESNLAVWNLRATKSTSCSNAYYTPPSIQDKILLHCINEYPFNSTHGTRLALPTLPTDSFCTRSMVQAKQRPVGSGSISHTHTRLVVFLVSGFNSVWVLALESHPCVVTAKYVGKAVLLRASFIADPCTCYCDFSKRFFLDMMQSSQTIDTTRSSND